MRPSEWKCSALLFAVLATGCGGSDGPELAETIGTVTYKGNPLPNASVVLIPANGPAAYCSTDKEGKFTLSTTGRPGAMVGKMAVAITAFEGLAEPKPEDKLTAADLKKMNTSLIPAKYGNADTSGLEAEIKPNVRNELKFDLE